MPDDFLNGLSNSLESVNNNLKEKFEQMKQDAVKYVQNKKADICILGEQDKIYKVYSGLLEMAGTGSLRPSHAEAIADTLAKHLLQLKMLRGFLPESKAGVFSAADLDYLVTDKSKDETDKEQADRVRNIKACWENRMKTIMTRRSEVATQDFLHNLDSDLPKMITAIADYVDVARGGTPGVGAARLKAVAGKPLSAHLAQADPSLFDFCHVWFEKDDLETALQAYSGINDPESLSDDTVGLQFVNDVRKGIAKEALKEVRDNILGNDGDQLVKFSGCAASAGEFAADVASVDTLFGDMEGARTSDECKAKLKAKAEQAILEGAKEKLTKAKADVTTSLENALLRCDLRVGILGINLFRACWEFLGMDKLDSDALGSNGLNGLRKMLTDLNYTEGLAEITDKLAGVPDRLDTLKQRRDDLDTTIGKIKDANSGLGNELKTVRDKLQDVSDAATLAKWSDDMLKVMNKYLAVNDGEG